MVPLILSLSLSLFFFGWGGKGIVLPGLFSCLPQRPLPLPALVPYDIAKHTQAKSATSFPSSYPRFPLSTSLPHKPVCECPRAVNYASSSFSAWGRRDVAAAVAPAQATNWPLLLLRLRSTAGCSGLQRAYDGKALCECWCRGWVRENWEGVQIHERDRRTFINTTLRGV